MAIELNETSLESDQRQAVLAANRPGLTPLTSDGLVLFTDLGIITTLDRGGIVPGAALDYLWEKAGVPPT